MTLPLNSMKTLSDKELIGQIMSFGKSREEVSSKLRTLGFNIDQSTLAKWEKMKNLSNPVRTKAERAHSLLQGAQSDLAKLPIISDVATLIEVVINLTCVKSLGGAKEFDLLPVVRAIQATGKSEVTLSDICRCLTMMLSLGNLDPVAAAKATFNL